MRFLSFLLTLLPVMAFAALTDIKEKSIEGADYNFKALDGKVVLVTNIASQCGYTPQLEKLEALYQKYKAKNFVVLGVPTNDFGGQTPEDDKGMKEFCSKTYAVTFPLLSKKTVKGLEMRPLYKYLTKDSAKTYQGDIAWNFEKFILNKKGEVVGRYKSNVDPMDKDLTAKIESLLK
jgi:glutathione peroxidase